MLIKDLWILLKEGLAIFQHVTSDDINPDLFAGMLSALNTFAIRLSEGGITSFDIDEQQRFVLVKEKNCIFVTRTHRHYDIKKILTELKEIAILFFKKYGDEKFEQWMGGDIKVFANFEEDLKSLWIKES